MTKYQEIYFQEKNISECLKDIGKSTRFASEIFAFSQENQLNDIPVGSLIQIFFQEKGEKV